MRRADLTTEAAQVQCVALLTKLVADVIGERDCSPRGRVRDVIVRQVVRVQED